MTAPATEERVVTDSAVGTDVPLVAHLPADRTAAFFGTISPGDLALCGAPLLGIEPFGNWSRCEACIELAGAL